MRAQWNDGAPYYIYVYIYSILYICLHKNRTDQRSLIILNIKYKIITIMFIGWKNWSKKYFSHFFSLKINKSKTKVKNKPV